MSRPVVFAELHDGFFVPGMGAVGGQFKKTLPPEKTLKDFSMALEDDGSLTLKWAEAGFWQTVSVGAATVKIARLAPEKIAAKPTETKGK